ncbi:hypothetical protein NP233_g6310 [Leucocoprinus birnbaumii]|uniref:Phytase-like domain-containing protein n=1 Tax=Leucocoprinus birnbaumii TaxID=56174 RepID=A0AAD5YTS6_9AGAR|nr:hypothetical protein NP233_g6310 [Leucocoprinus birnbaumii]
MHPTPEQLMIGKRLRDLSASWIRSLRDTLELLSVIPDSRPPLPTNFPFSNTSLKEKIHWIEEYGSTAKRYAFVVHLEYHLDTSNAWSPAVWIVRSSGSILGKIEVDYRILTDPDSPVTIDSDFVLEMMLHSLLREAPLRLSSRIIRNQGPIIYPNLAGNIEIFELRTLNDGLLASAATEPSTVNSVSLGGVTYVNKGLVGFGLIPSNFKESTGDTLGGIGSAIALKPGTWTIGSNGQYTGTLIVHPDRGYNVEETIDYQARHQEIAFTLTPYYGSSKLNFTAAQQTLALQYKNTVLEYDTSSLTTSGLDPQGIRQPAQVTQSTFPAPLPIVSSGDNRLTLDVEGIIANADGSFWISDEYAPGIYRISPSATVVQSLPIPSAILPLDKNGNLKFTSEDDPKTGRAGNQGFEGLTIDPSTGRIYAMLQSATIQDGGDDKSTSRYTRLVAYDVQGDTSTLAGEWIVPLPQSSKGNTRGCSEIHFVSDGVFLALSRDGNGRGDDDDDSDYKNADLFSIKGATDIHGTKFDSPSTPASPGGKLDKSITPATYVSFVSLIDDDQLKRFGLHNGDPDDSTLINGKWESLALAPVGDASFPDDYFLFTVSDNDFMSTQGVSSGNHLMLDSTLTISLWSSASHFLAQSSNHSSF